MQAIAAIRPKTIFSAHRFCSVRASNTPLMAAERDHVSQQTQRGGEKFYECVSQRSPGDDMANALKHHWPEYLMEAGCLGLFMISAFTFGALLGHPASPVYQSVPNPILRRFLMGLVMGATAITIIYSPWGKQSGAHINPSTTLTFLRLGKISMADAVLYVISQFIGGSAGALVASAILAPWVSHPSVNYVVTMPGSAGIGIAFLAEIVITFVLMTVILHVSNNVRLHKFTGVFAGALVAIYITFEAPISGMSMNPARTFASAIAAHYWTALWIYFTAPLIGMFSAAEVYRCTRGGETIRCAKLHHDNDKRCIFCGKPAGKVDSKLISDTARSPAVRIPFAVKRP